MNQEQKLKIVAALIAGVKELGIVITSWSVDMEQAEGQGEWGKNRAAAILRDIERAEKVQDQMLEAIQEINT